MVVVFKVSSDPQSFSWVLVAGPVISLFLGKTPVIGMSTIVSLLFRYSVLILA